MKRLLFVCWDGPQVNYLEGLFLPIFVGLKDEYEVHIIQFSWATNKKVQSLKTTCENAGVAYNHFHVFRKPLPLLGSILSLGKGINYLKKYIRVNGIDVIMPRSTFPALMTLSAIKGNDKLRLIFDADGLPLDERVDFSGLSQSSIQFRYLKSVERKAVKTADVVITRTNKAVSILTEREPALKSKFQVVTNGRDTKFFSPINQSRQIRTSLGVSEEAILLVYSGSLGPQYCVLEMLKMYHNVKHLEPNSYLLILTGTPEFLNQPQFTDLLDSNVIIKRVDFNEMPLYLSAADVGLAIRQPSYSMQGVAPIKIGEYLLTELPVVASSGIGDTENLLADKSCCYILPNHEDSSLKRAAEWVVSVAGDSSINRVARRLGEEAFSLERSVELYKLSLKKLN